MYRERFENIFRVAQNITSSLNIGDILEMIRDEAKVIIPYAKEACLLVLDQDACHYTRPLHCSVFKDRLNCQLCKRGRKTVQKAMARTTEIQCAFYEEEKRCQECALGLATRRTPEGPSGPSAKGVRSVGGGDKPCDIAFPIYDGEKPLAVLELIAQEGYCFNERDAILLRDLVRLATNAIINARLHWAMSPGKIEHGQDTDPSPTLCP